MKVPCGLLFIIAVLGSACQMQRKTQSSLPYEAWNNGPPHNAEYFPLAVWLQDPELAEEYKKAGINTYVGLWRGPTEKQLDLLQRAGMKVICHQNETAIRHLGDPTIIGWLQNDEPDNAQPLSDGEGYGPPIHPEKVVSTYRELARNDPTRPVLLNLGQGVAWDNWHGRGPRTDHPEDYREYMKGGDIISFDIYPASHSDEEVAGNLWYVARGVERLAEWRSNDQVIWNCLETTHIGNPERKITPHELRSEAWMALIHGSRGLIYFVHEFEPAFNAGALLDDSVLLAAVTTLNREITGLAPVLNSPAVKEKKQAGAVSSNPAMPVAVLTKQYQGNTYLFATGMRADTTIATFSLRSYPGTARVRVIGEDRSIRLTEGRFQDEFGPWEVHLYQIEH